MVRSTGWVVRGPVCRATLSIALLVLVALSLGGCEKEPTLPPQPPARNFRLGVVPFPAEANTPSFTEAMDFVGGHADLVVHHFDDGVPWETSVLGQDPPLEIRDRKSVV